MKMEWPCRPRPGDEDAVELDCRAIGKQEPGRWNDNHGPRPAFPPRFSHFSFLATISKTSAEGISAGGSGCNS
jgi:hypothetical protein